MNIKIFALTFTALGLSLGAILNRTPLSDNTTEEELRGMIKVKKSIFL